MFKRILAIILLGLMSSMSYAKLVININQGVDRPYPIAVVPFGSDVTLNSLPQGMTGVIGNDLSLSGKFSLLDKTAMPNFPHSVSAIDWSVWNKASTGVEYMVVGSVSPDAQGYTVSFALMSILGGKPLVAQQFNGIPAKEMRALAHHISDVIYQSLTGVAGIFSTRIAYVNVLNQGLSNATYRLVVADFDGYNSKILFSQKANPIASPAWSPDGKTLAYVSYHNNRMVVVGLNLENGSRKILAGYPGMNSAPAFSPDNRKLAVALSRGAGAQTNIFVVDLASGKLTQYTRSANNTSPCFSPDGSTLVFNSDKSGQPQIYKLDLSAGGATRISLSGLKNFSPVYTPDGKKIVMMHQDEDSGTIQLATLDLQTGVINVITHGELDKSPSVAPNGVMVVYANYDRLSGVLRLSTINGKFDVTLPALGGSNQSPAWSPFL